MPQDNVIKLIQPGFFDDQLTGILRNGARALLAKAVEAEVAGRSALRAGVSSGSLPRPRELTTFLRLLALLLRSGLTLDRKSVV